MFKVLITDLKSVRKTFKKHILPDALFSINVPYGTAALWGGGGGESSYYYTLCYQVSLSSFATTHPLQLAPWLAGLEINCLKKFVLEKVWPWKSLALKKFGSRTNFGVWNILSLYSVCTLFFCFGFSVHLLIFWVLDSVCTTHVAIIWTPNFLVIQKNIRFLFPWNDMA